MFFFSRRGLVLYWLTTKSCRLAQQTSSTRPRRRLAAGAGVSAFTPSRRADRRLATAAAAGDRIVRLSGARSTAFSRALTGVDLLPRRAVRCTIADAGGATIDYVLADPVPAPASTPDEDVLELHGHGGPVVLRWSVARCLEVAASPTPRPVRRARELRPAAGRVQRTRVLQRQLDLAQARLVADLIDASTEVAGRSSARSIEGALSTAVDALAAETVDLRVRVEATLESPTTRSSSSSGAARASVAGAARAPRGGRRNGAPGCAPARRPHGRHRRPANAGKSSLPNALAGAEVAIVTPIAGTTRDRVGESIEIEGVRCGLSNRGAARRRRTSAMPSSRIASNGRGSRSRRRRRRLRPRPDARAGAAYGAADARIGAQLGGRAGRRVARQSTSPQARTSFPSPTRARRGSRVGHDRRGSLMRFRGVRSSNAPAGARTAEGVFIARRPPPRRLARADSHLAAAAAQADSGDAALELLAEELALATTRSPRSRRFQRRDLWVRSFHASASASEFGRSSRCGHSSSTSHCARCRRRSFRSMEIDGLVRAIHSLNARRLPRAH